MKKYLYITFLITIILLTIVSCADRDSLPAAIVYTRALEDIPATTEITVETILTEVETTEIIDDESISLPVTVLPILTELPLYSSEGNIPIILNINSGMYHLDDECMFANNIFDENKRVFSVDDLSVLSDYSPCSRCAKLIEIETESEIVSLEPVTAILNLNSRTFHADINCRHIKTMKEENKSNHTGTIDEIKAAGYKACGTCSKQYRD